MVARIRQALRGNPVRVRGFLVALAGGIANLIVGEPVAWDEFGAALFGLIVLVDSSRAVVKPVPDWKAEVKAAVLPEPALEEPTERDFEELAALVEPGQKPKRKPTTKRGRK